MYFTQVLDTGNRLSSAGTALVPQNTNYASAAKSAAAISIGAPVATANSGLSRTISHHTFRGATIDVVHDRFVFNWGLASSDGSVIPSATYGHFSVNCPPLVIPPGASFLIHEWETSQSTGATYEFEFGYAEK